MTKKYASKKSENPLKSRIKDLFGESVETSGFKSSRDINGLMCLVQGDRGYILADPVQKAPGSDGEAEARRQYVIDRVEQLKANNYDCMFAEVDSKEGRLVGISFNLRITRSAAA